MLKYYVKHVYSSIPGDGKEVEFLMEALFCRNLAAKKLEDSKSYLSKIFYNLVDA